MLSNSFSKNAWGSTSRSSLVNELRCASQDAFSDSDLQLRDVSIYEDLFSLPSRPNALHKRNLQESRKQTTASLTELMLVLTGEEQLTLEQDLD